MENQTVDDALQIDQDTNLIKEVRFRNVNPILFNESMSLKNFNNWQISTRFSVVSGPNGSGKTHLLTFIKNSIELRNQLTEKKIHFLHHSNLIMSDTEKNELENFEKLAREVEKSMSFYRCMFVLSNDGELTNASEQKINNEYIATARKLKRYLNELNFRLNCVNMNESYFEKNNASNWIRVTRPSCGEIYFLNMINILYKCDFSKVNIILLDEPDRHLEPKLIEMFLDFIYELMSNKPTVQIILTTHRPDTIALLRPQSTCSTRIYVIHKGCIKACHKLECMFRLTYNLKDIIDFKIKVYLEAHDDYVFYENIYQLLLGYCSHERKRQKFEKETANGRLVWKLSDSVQFRLLSRRYRLEFFPASEEKNGQSGGCTQVKYSIKRDLSTCSLLSNSMDKTPTQMNILIHPDLRKPFGIIDGDLDASEPSDGKRKPSDELEHRLLTLKRYSIENFIYDPILFCSLFCTLANDDVERLFDQSNPELKSICSKLINELRSASRIKVDDHFYSDVIVQSTNRHDFLTKCFRELFTTLGQNELVLRDDEIAHMFVEIFYSLNSNCDTQYPESIFDSIRVILTEVYSRLNVEQAHEQIDAITKTFLEIFIVNIFDKPTENDNNQDVKSRDNFVVNVALINATLRDYLKLFLNCILNRTKYSSSFDRFISLMLKRCQTNFAHKKLDIKELQIVNKQRMEMRQKKDVDFKTILKQLEAMNEASKKSTNISQSAQCLKDRIEKFLFTECRNVDDQIRSVVVDAFGLACERLKNLNFHNKIDLIKEDTTIAELDLITAVLNSEFRLKTVESEQQNITDFFDDVTFEIKHYLDRRIFDWMEKNSDLTSGIDLDESNLIRELGLNVTHMILTHFEFIFYDQAKISKRNREFKRFILEKATKEKIKHDLLNIICEQKIYELMSQKPSNEQNLKVEIKKCFQINDQLEKLKIEHNIQTIYKLIIKILKIELTEIVNSSILRINELIKTRLKNGDIKFKMDDVIWKKMDSFDRICSLIDQSVDSGTWLKDELEKLHLDNWNQCNMDMLLSIGQRIMNLGSLTEIIERVCKDCCQIDYLTANGLLTFNYPYFLLYMRGHDIETIVDNLYTESKTGTNDYLSTQIIMQLAVESKRSPPAAVLIPVDLAKTIFDLNQKVINQTRRVIKRLNFNYIRLFTRVYVKFKRQIKSIRARLG